MYSFCGQVADMTEIQQQVANDLVRLNGQMSATLTTTAFNERRLMSENSKPHEVIMMIMSCFADFEPAGDC